jgi:predicted nucleotidyltransferase
VFGDALAGAYLHGSAVQGGLRPTSDLDLMAVVNRRTTRDERRRLRDGLLPLSGPPRRLAPIRPVEVTVVRDADVKPWHYPPRMEALFGEWLRPDYERGVVPEPAANPDLAPLIAVMLTGNHRLLGPPAPELFAPVPAADLRGAIVVGLAEWTTPDKLETDTRNMLLALARTWHTLATGEIAGKDVAGAWAAKQLDGSDAKVVARARRQYLTGTHGRWRQSIDAAKAAADRILAEIQMLAANRQCSTRPTPSC